MRIRVYLLICLLVCPACSATAEDRPRNLAGELPRDLVTISTGEREETITVNARDTAPHKVFTLPDPDRLVVDVPAVRGHPRVALPSSYEGKLIKAVRFGQFDPKTSRLVFDLRQPVHVSVHDDESKNGQLVIGIAKADEKEAAKDSGSPSGFLFGKSLPKNEPAPESKAESKPEPKVEPKTEPKPELKAEPKAVKSAKKEKKTKKSFAVAKPAKPVIVIDPGHGGIDPGTAGSSGVEEKNVVLAYARALRVRLMKSGHYTVLLTRDSDRFIMLRQRVAIARKAEASLFISLHADSAPDDVRGLSVYTVSEKASDQEAEALATRENKSDVLAGMDLSDEREDVAGILISLAERETKNHSAALADELVTSLDDKVELLSNTHRFAGFAVLKAPDIPSVLIEIGFLSHPSEEKLLLSKAYRDKVISGIASGVDGYFHLEKRMGDQ